MKGGVVIFANLKPRSLDGYPSNGMLLAGSNENGTELLRPDSAFKPGERVYIEGNELPEEF